MHLDASKAAGLIKVMQDRHLLVIGDIMLDRFVDGTVSRISPEAPVPILGQSQIQQMPGGAANVACNLAQLGARVTLIGACSNDTTAEVLASELHLFPTIKFLPLTIAGRPTSLKTRYRASGQQILRVDDEVTDNIDNKYQKKLFEMAEPSIKSTDMLILSDYAKGCLPPNLIRKLIGIAKSNKKLVVSDPKLMDLSVYRGADFLTPNLSELIRATGKELNTLDEIGATASRVAKENDIDTVITTLSAQGILASSSDGTQYHNPTSTRDVFDVSGAGDTVVAIISIAIASGADLETAISMANHAAGAVVGKSGTAIVSPGEILAHLPVLKPLTNAATLAKTCQDWRNAGNKIAFANGCFDLLHPGHISLLKQASSVAERLIIGLNSDSSVSRLKGSSRPVQSVDIRAAAISAFDIVDAVTVFDEDTPINLIKMLQPDFILKGGDYQPDEVIGSNIVKARGGKVIIVPTHATYSTSKLFNSH